MSSRSVLLLLCLALLTGCAGDTPPAAETAEAPDPLVAKVSEAQGLLGSGQFAEAAGILQEVTAADPERGQAWQLLGVALRNDGQLDEAEAAYRRSYDFPGNRGGAATGLVLVHAARDELDAAAEWLDKALSAPGSDVSTIATQPALAALRDDERFAVLYPPAEAYERSPFVEDVEILHEWRGQQGDSFGWEARALGDVDGDGIRDAVVSSPANSPPGDGRGRVDVFSGKSGELIWQALGADGAQLGVSIENARDVDGDGITDVVAGALGAGQAFVYSGSDGSVLHTFDAPADAGNAGASGFGNKVAGVGDVNGDGHGDLLVGAPGAGQGQDHPGMAYLFSGKDGERLLELSGEEAGDSFGTSVAGGSQDGRFWLVVGAPNGGEGDRGRVYVYTALDPEPAFVIDPEESGQQLGAMFLSVVGDVDGDGSNDVYASDFSDGSAGPLAGRIYVHSGSTGERLLTLAGEQAGDGFGIGPARAGDLDGDGADDLVVGAWQQADAAPSGGGVYVHSGRSGEVLGKITCNVPGDTFGFDADGIGDVDGDGVPDLLLTSAWSAVDGPRSGRTFVVSGKSVLD